MLKLDDKIKGIDIDIELTLQQQALLASYIKTEGFDILQRLMEDQVKKFNIKLIDTDPSDAAQVLANHHMAKAVAQWYVGLISTLEEILQVDRANNDPARNEPENHMQLDGLR